jgi:hypothetical protein
MFCVQCSNLGQIPARASDQPPHQRGHTDRRSLRQDTKSKATVHRTHPHTCQHDCAPDRRCRLATSSKTPDSIRATPSLLSGKPPPSTGQRDTHHAQPHTPLHPVMSADARGKAQIGTDEWWAAGGGEGKDGGLFGLHSKSEACCSSRLSLAYPLPP